MSSFHKNSALKNLLLALVPYTEQNLMLSFYPSRFFNELEKSGHSKTSIRQAYYRAKKEGYVSADDKLVKLTKKGIEATKPYLAPNLKGAKLMLIFDIPESQRSKRYHLRLLLKDLQFRQVQKSVWMTDIDHRQTVAMAIEQLGIEGYVQLYECLPVRLVTKK